MTGDPLQALRGRLTCTVEEAAALLGVSRSLAYTQAERGEIPSKKIGGRRVVLVLPLLRQLGAAELLAAWRDDSAA